MAKQLLCSGPAELQVGFYLPGVPVFQQTSAQLFSLGWSEAGVYVDNEPAYEDTFTDFSGPRVPLDKQLQGQHSYVTCDLKLIDWSVLRLIRRRSADGAPNPGLLTAGSIGAFVGQEGLAHRLLVFPPFIAKPSQAGAVEPFNFGFATLLGPDRWDRYSASAAKFHAVWHCLNIFDSSGNATNYDQSVVGKATFSFP